MRNFSFLISVVVLALLMMRCSSQKSWVYRPNSYGVESNQVQKSVVVTPFKDSRENVNKDMVRMYYIPLVPFGWQRFDIPEGSMAHTNSGMWANYAPKDDFAKALVQELQEARVVKEVFFDYKKGNSDLQIKGEILNTKYNGKILTYGLSIYGGVLWYIGAPMSIISNELSIELSIIDSKTDKILFSKTYIAPKYKKTSWVYFVKSDFNYSEMLKGLYNQFVEDFKNSFSRK